MNTKKHMINVAIATTLALGAIYIFFLGSAFYKGYANVPASVSVILWLVLGAGVIIDLFLLLKTRKTKRKVKFFDFNEDGYPIDMQHNDEREWRMMLTATYISSRLTVIYLIIAFLIPYAIILSGIELGAFFWAFFAGTVVFLAIMVNEWGYVISYIHLDRA
ncbi:hypothetical protein YK48G_11080 [Lentilactobacillus fungorum]|uniref:DUF3169 domain-containing protein n=1 Tax=Lentilactobacillus fungorum TaxID=2201250 RepID=A0ABQ3VXP9_9LACO|nr:hypothetical protein [Lentilactobacillus fungorum]GHP13683.1 hypothetical protein YK48G_11080 [Lentilactobacillus fungorum]